MGLNKQRLHRINNAIIKKPYVFYFVLIFLAYIGLNLLLNQTYSTFGVLFNTALWFLIPNLLLGFLIIPFLVALTINLVIMKFRGLKALGGSRGSLTALGIFGGALGGACPGCFVGLFPAFLGLFGITASLSILPLKGLELQMLSVVFLIVAVILLTRDLVCEIPINKKTNKNG